MLEDNLRAFPKPNRRPGRRREAPLCSRASGRRRRRPPKTSRCEARRGLMWVGSDEATMRGQGGFFEVDDRLKELSAKGDDLERLNAIVP